MSGPIAYLAEEGWLCPDCWSHGFRRATPYFREHMAQAVPVGHARCECGQTLWPQAEAAPEPCVFYDITAGEASVEWAVRPLLTRRKK